MAKKKDKKRFKNPLAHLKTRDLLITLITLIVIFVSGFFAGYSCSKKNNKVEALADVITTNAYPVKPGGGQDDSSNSFQYVFNFYLGDYMFTANFVIYKQYTPSYLTSSHWLALAYNNNYSPIAYVSQQLHEYTSEEEYYGLEFSPGDTNVEYEIYYTWYDDEYSSKFLYNEDTYYNHYTVRSYSNLENGGFNSKFKYLLTFPYGFGIVLENGSWWGVQMRDGLYGSFEDYLVFGLGTIYSYQDLFGINTSDVYYQAGYDNGYLDGHNEGYDEGYEEGFFDGDIAGYYEGKVDGYNKGYNEGTAQTLSEITPWQHIVNGVNSFLGIELFPGVSFAIIVQLAFGLVLLGIVWKTFLGG